MKLAREMDDVRLLATVQSGAEDTEERVLLLHIEMCDEVKSLPWRKDITSNVSLLCACSLACGASHTRH